LVAYHARFAPLFQRAEQRRWAAVYLRGLLAELPRKNVEGMALRVLGAGLGAERRVRALQQFIGEGSWDDAALLAEHRCAVEETLGDDDGVLIIDGSDLPKRGTHSAGVARQWCGATGKTENCQAGVFLGYASSKGHTLLDRRLYLPQAWFSPDYRSRWEACRIPDDQPFATKTVLAAAMVEQAMAVGRPRARWCLCDEWYGRDSTFLDRIAATGLRYFAEVPKDTAVWPLVNPTDGTPQERPQSWLPPRAASGTGRPRTRVRLDPRSPAPLRLDVLATHLRAEAWQRYRVLEGRKGPLVADFAAVRAVAVREGLPGPEVWVLLRRPLPTPDDAPNEAPKLKYLLSDAPAATPLATLVSLSGRRWPIESCFEEGKGLLGLDQYELRFWRGWHHHMTMVILAQHFLVRLRQRLKPREGGPAAERAIRPCRLPGRATSSRVAPSPGATAAAHADARPNPPPAVRRLAPTAAQPCDCPWAHRLLPAPQPGRVSLAPPAYARPLGGTQPLSQVSLSY
jgi:SRSO17 transposase